MFSQSKFETGIVRKTDTERIDRDRENRHRQRQRQRQGQIQKERHFHQGKTGLKRTDTNYHNHERANRQIWRITDRQMTEPMNKDGKTDKKNKVDKRKIDGTENAEKEKMMSLKQVSLSNDRH